MPDEALGHGGEVAVRDAVTLQPTGLQMRGGDLQAVAVPSTGRKAGPRVGRMFRGMRTSIQPDQARRLPERSKQLVADRFLCDRIELSRDADVGRPSQ